MAVVVEEDAFVAGVSSERGSIFPRLFGGRVEQELVSCAHAQLLVLGLQGFSDLVHGRVARGL